MPCKGRAPGASKCHAHEESRCRKVLVVIGDDTQPMPADSLIAWWLAQGASYAVLPMIPQVSSGAIRRLLPPEVHRFHTISFTVSPGERVDDVLALAGVTTEDRRVFISYRQQETREIAEQLFEELEKHRFAVFLDRFRMLPGADFQERLTDELAHKSMVLVLESPTILLSPWVGHELTFARVHELGRLAVQLPGAVLVPWIDSELRVMVDGSELEPPASRSVAVSAEQRLGSVALQRVITALVAEHGRALLRRRAALIDAMRMALARRGIADQRLDPRGHLHVMVTTGGSKREYVLWATPRPPEVDDFRMAHTVCDPGPHPSGVIMVPVHYGEVRRRERSEWLAKRSLVRLHDIGRIEAVADRISHGEDLP
jgi:TIR domain-containing protein